MTGSPDSPGLRRGGDGSWAATGYADVQAVLSDGRLEVVPAPAGDAVATIGWLRASVSRFSNGRPHQQRRALAVAELDRLEPGALRRDAHRRAAAVLAAAPGPRIDVMATLARPVPMAALAAALGAGDPAAAAVAAERVAAAYFPGADQATVRRADLATAALVELLGPVDLDVAVARISLLAQACDATAGLIGNALVLDAATGPDAPRPTGALLDAALREAPVVTAIRRTAREPAAVAGAEVAAGETVVCDVAAANADPVLAGAGEPPLPSLTFGYGLRPCPGPAQALALAGGVLDAVREGATAVAGQPVSYQPGPLRIPVTFAVERR